MSKKILTPCAMPRQAEVISLAAYRTLRSAYHPPHSALFIIRNDSSQVAKLEESFAGEFSKRLGRKGGAR